MLISSREVFGDRREEGGILHPLTITLGDLELSLSVQPLLVEGAASTDMSAHRAAAAKGWESHFFNSNTRGSSSSSAGEVAAPSWLVGTVLSCVFWSSLLSLLSLLSLFFLSAVSSGCSFLSPLASFSCFRFCFSSYSFFTRSISSSSSRFLRASMAAWSILGVQKPGSLRWAGQT